MTAHLPIVATTALLFAAAGQTPAPELPADAAAQLAASLEAARPHADHVWRDAPPVNADGTVNAYIEIARGDRRKWELDIGANTLVIDRMLPPDADGFPANYGFVPQTISYDGDPFDALVLGPPIDGGHLVRGVVMGVLFMEDEKGPDAKVVLAPAGPGGRPVVAPGADDEQRIAAFFNSYKRGQPDAFSRVSGWGSVADGHTFISMTHAFFRQCAGATGPCRIGAGRVG